MYCNSLQLFTQFHFLLLFLFFPQVHPSIFLANFAPSLSSLTK